VEGLRENGEKGLKEYSPDLLGSSRIITTTTTDPTLKIFQAAFILFFEVVILPLQLLKMGIYVLERCRAF